MAGKKVGMAKPSTGQRALQKLDTLGLFREIFESHVLFDVMAIAGFVALETIFTSARQQERQLWHYLNPTINWPTQISNIKLKQQHIAVFYDVFFALPPVKSFFPRSGDGT